MIELHSSIEGSLAFLKKERKEIFDKSNVIISYNIKEDTLSPINLEESLLHVFKSSFNSLGKDGIFPFFVKMPFIDLNKINLESDEECDFSPFSKFDIRIWAIPSIFKNKLLISSGDKIPEESFKTTKYTTFAEHEVGLKPNFSIDLNKDAFDFVKNNIDKHINISLLNNFKTNEIVSLSKYGVSLRVDREEFILTPIGVIHINVKERNLFDFINVDIEKLFKIKLDKRNGWTEKSINDLARNIIDTKVDIDFS